MAEFPSKVSTRTSSPAQGAGASVSALRPDLGFVRSRLGALMLLQLVRARAPPQAGRGLPVRPGFGSVFANLALPTRAHSRTDALRVPQGRFPHRRPPQDRPAILSPLAFLVAVPESASPCSECPLPVTHRAPSKVVTSGHREAST
ncbi:hypothetical protein P7K49_036414 [Saguinus oedipus]|uniref:Uncharacterized protein n=1 Tax=Saguinus oedipus TaxID=9490 RepID=A0ABQ9TK12_SAGOE|nr:hypothetical protein P7K49_036414 [Saguinus oedipus]